MFSKLFIYLIEVSFKVGVGGDMSSRVGEEKVGHVREAGAQTFSEGLELWVHLFFHFQLFVKNIVTAL